MATNRNKRGNFELPEYDNLNRRPRSHAKKVGTGTATPVKGEKDRGASRKGVGQTLERGKDYTVNGFISKSPKSIAKNAKKDITLTPPRRRY